MKNVAFLDPSQMHLLTEQECELITFYRSMSKTKQQTFLHLLFSMLKNEADKNDMPKV